jgi:hypothetical protein
MPVRSRFACIAIAPAVRRVRAGGVQELLEVLRAAFGVLCMG